MSTILVTAPRLAPAGAQWLAEAGARVLYLPQADDERALEHLLASEPVDAVISRTVQLSAQAIDACPTLKVISKHGVGVSNIDVAAATRRGIPVYVTPGANAQSVAEMALGLMLAAARRIGWMDRELHAGRWQRAQDGLELRGRTLGLVGFGQVGQRLAAVCQALGMEIAAHDPALAAGTSPVPGVRLLPSLDALLAVSHVLSLHVPLNAHTRGMLGAAQFARLPRGAILVNTARGEVVDEAALVAGAAKRPTACGRARHHGRRTLACRQPAGRAGQRSADAARWRLHARGPCRHGAGCCAQRAGPSARHARRFLCLRQSAGVVPRFQPARRSARMTVPSSPSTSSVAPLQWPAGYRIAPRADGPAAGIVAAFREIPVAAIGDAMSRNVGTIGLRQYHARLDTVLCGPAVTVRVRPGDNLMIHKALMMVQPGDVLVIDGGGDVSQALVGGLMRTTCITKKLAGLVIDGAVRDLTEWAEDGMPLFAKGHTHRGPSKDGPGEINIPIACAGLAVQPGDLIVGDADGVIAIPAAEAADVLARSRAHLKKEAKIRADNQAGTSDPERFDAALRAKGLPI